MVTPREYTPPLYRCRHSDVCPFECNHKTPHKPFKDGGCLPCQCHVHVCLGLNGERVPSKFEGMCFIV
jgi:hypothetical protein